MVVSGQRLSLGGWSLAVVGKVGKEKPGALETSNVQPAAGCCRRQSNFGAQQAVQPLAAAPTTHSLPSIPHVPHVPRCLLLPLPRLLLPACSFVIKKAEKRYQELAGMGIACRLICVGRKGSVYFKRRSQYTVECEWCN